MRQVLVDETLQAEFASKGYVKVPWLSPQELESLLAGFAELRPDDEFVPDRPYATYHCSFLDTSIEYKRQAHDLVAKAFAPHFVRYLADFRMLNANFYVKPPGTGEFSVHQNWPALADLNDTSVTVWCPLADVVRENGAIQVVAGSHKITPHVEAPRSPAYFEAFNDVLIAEHLKPVPMKAGEAIIFDDSLIHWSSRNESDEPRVAIQAMCIPTTATPAFFAKHSEHEFELVEADRDFFIEQGPADLQVRQPHWRSLGFIDNLNRPVSLEDFGRLLADGDRTRSELQAAPAPRRAPKPAVEPAPEPAPTRRFGRLSRLLRG